MLLEASLDAIGIDEADDDDTVVDGSDSSVDDFIYADDDDECDNDAALPQWLARLMSSKYVGKINNVLCIYIAAANGWMPIMSRVALRFIADACGAHNATVSYDRAAMPSVDIVKRRTWPSVYIDSTFTQGTCRYYFQCSNNSYVNFYRVGSQAKPASYYSFCVVPALGFRTALRLPLSLEKYPMKGNCALKWVHDLFKQNTITMLWALGSALSDFGSKRCFVIYGPGGLGKSAVVKLFKAVLGDQTSEIPSEYMCYKPSSFVARTPSASMLLDAACSRAVFISDFELHDNDEYNFRTIKPLTGDDPLHGVSVCVTVVATTNHMPANIDPSKHITPDRMRRLAVVSTIDERYTEDINCLPLDKPGLSQLAHIAMVVRIKYNKPPMNTETLLMTLFLGQYEAAMHLIQINYGATRMDCIAATKFLCIKFNIKARDMSNSLFRIGSDCVIRVWNRCYIANIMPRAGASLASDEELKAAQTAAKANEGKKPSKFSANSKQN